MPDNDAPKKPNEPAEKDWLTKAMEKAEAEKHAPSRPLVFCVSQAEYDWYMRTIDGRRRFKDGR